MKKILFFVCALLVLAGCSGDGDNFNDNRFTGDWVGTIFAGNNDGETMRLHIREDGIVTGTETVGNQIANINGNIDRNGRFDLRSRISGTQDVFYTGDANINANDRMIGQGTATQGSTTVNIDFNLRREFF
jgi:hypothetical protein